MLRLLWAALCARPNRTATQIHQEHRVRIAAAVRVAQAYGMTDPDVLHSFRQELEDTCPSHGIWCCRACFATH